MATRKRTPRKKAASPKAEPNKEAVTTTPEAPVIESSEDIPVPPRRLGKYKQYLEALEPGQTVFFAGVASGGLSSSMSNIRRQYPDRVFRTSVRSEGQENGVAGTRVWRLE